MLGLEFASKRGHIGLEYYGRTVGVKIMPVGVHMDRLRQGLAMADTEWRLGELKAQFEGKTVLLGVDDMDIFKGIGGFFFIQITEAGAGVQGHFLGVLRERFRDFHTSLELCFFVFFFSWKHWLIFLVAEIG